MKTKPLTYADAGVDLAAWEETRKRISTLVKSTYNNKVVSKFGQFGGLFDVSMLKDYKRPILVSSVDGVGTKLKIAFETGIHDTIGEDIVNHCVNDIVVMGAKPLYFLDYIGTGVLSPQITEQFMLGLTRACKNSDLVLIGGETAEMPGIYSKGEYDIAGTIVGVVDEENILDGKKICPGNLIVGLRSNGLHTNGYSLARKIVKEVDNKKYSDIFEKTGNSFGKELLKPHRSYSPILYLTRKGLIKGCAHITGGGFKDNICRILPENCDAVINTQKWEPDAIFQHLQEKGGVEKAEMYRTFNMGIGMALVIDSEKSNDVINSKELALFNPIIIGNIIEGTGSVKIEF